MKTYYKNNLKEAYLILEGEEEEAEGYQLAMLRENEIPGVLKVSVRYVDGKCHYYYEISGKTCFKAMHEISNLECEDIRKLVEALLQAIKELQKYMLPENSILLEPEYIFCEKGSYFFCYYPPCKEELKENFHKLTEFFVREVNYKDEEGVRLAYMLHKSSMEENYSLEQILEEFEKEEKEQEIVDYRERMEKLDFEDDLIAEKMEMWEPVRRFLERRKKTCK